METSKRTTYGGPISPLLQSLSLTIFFLIAFVTDSGAQLPACLSGRQVTKHKPLSALQVNVRQIYMSQIGVRERQPNSGPAVEQYLRYVNLPKGNPWCAAFVCWVYGQAGVENPRSGWSPALFGEGRVIWGRGVSSIKNQESRLVADKPYKFPSNAIHGISTPARCAYRPLAGAGGGFRSQNPVTPSTGDVFGLYFPEKRRIAHVGFIDKWDGTWLVTVEGNTNVSGSREGDGVYRKMRLVRSVYKVARYVE